jgi:site-specific DNA-methyltransferase (cytosine-N4-specific)
VQEGWFPQPQLYQLTHIRNRINSLSTKYPDRTLKFLKICLSGTVRKSSYQRNGEFKRYRLSEEDRETHNPNVLNRFNKIIEGNREKILEYSEQVDHDLSAYITQFDSRFASEMDLLNDQQADIVITSPPYGDHQTTVAYGQFSTNPMVVIDDAGFSEVFDVDKKGLGGKHNYDNSIEGLEQKSESLHKTLSKLRDEEGRSSDAFQFFSDYYDVLFETGEVTKSGQPVVWVVANRTMSGISIPMQLITQELCEELSYETEVVLSRGIRNKTLPYQNSPTGKSGDKGELMADESLVVTRAP